MRRIAYTLAVAGLLTAVTAYGQTYTGGSTSGGGQRVTTSSSSGREVRNNQDRTTTTTNRRTQTNRRNTQTTRGQQGTNQPAITTAPGNQFEVTCPFQSGTGLTSVHIRYIASNGVETTRSEVQSTSNRVRVNPSLLCRQVTRVNVFCTRNVGGRVTARSSEVTFDKGRCEGINQGLSSSSSGPVGSISGINIEGLPNNEDGSGDNRDDSNGIDGINDDIGNRGGVTF